MDNTVCRKKIPERSIRPSYILILYHTGAGPSTEWLPPRWWCFGKCSRCWSTWRRGGRWTLSPRAKPTWRCTSAWWTETDRGDSSESRLHLLYRAPKNDLGTTLTSHQFPIRIYWDRVCIGVSQTSPQVLPIPLTGIWAIPVLAHLIQFIMDLLIGHLKQVCQYWNRKWNGWGYSK